jgi:hypothetical protein
MFMPSRNYLMLRSDPELVEGARLEARTAWLQLRYDRVDQFPDSLESGNPRVLMAAAAE